MIDNALRYIHKGNTEAFIVYFISILIGMAGLYYYGTTTRYFGVALNIIGIWSARGAWDKLERSRKPTIWWWDK